MPLLDDLADYLTEETDMTVHEAVLVMSYDPQASGKRREPGEVPKVRFFTDGVINHGFFRAPAGLFMCRMTNEGKDPFFSEMEQGNIAVDDVVRLDPKLEFKIEPNWPSRKVDIDGTYYALPRNFARQFQEIVEQAQVKKKRRR